MTFTFTDPIDASRGDVVVGIEAEPAMTQRIDARMFWMNSDALRPERRYLFKLATTTVTARVEAEMSIIDLDTRRLVAVDALAQNEVGLGTLKLDRPIAVDHYAECRDTGSFILIDPETFDTVAMGCVERAEAYGASAASSALTVRGKLTRWTETHARSFVKAVSWRATGSLDTFVVTFVITGSTKIAGSVAVTEIVTKILIYYLHERMWA